MLAGPPVNELAKTYVGVDETGRLADADLRQRITDHLMEAQAHALTGERIALEARTNRGPSATSSIMKNAGTMIRKERAELAVEILGAQGIGWGGEGFSEYETNAIRVMLRSKSGTIAGGSQEVQNNIIAKRILGLPDTTHST
jgi:alkylation response protein AidB-like acyl-CoA dehydrogenase